MATKRPSAGGNRPMTKRPNIQTQTATADREKAKPGVPSQNDRGSRIFGPASRR
jgi:hypothetical protein